MNEKSLAGNAGAAINPGLPARPPPDANPPPGPAGPRPKSPWPGLPPIRPPDKLRNPSTLSLKKLVRISRLDVAPPCDRAGTSVRISDRLLEAHERYFRRYTTVVSVSAGSGPGSPYISHEWPADSLRFAAIHFRIASCASFMRLYDPQWTATAASPAGVSVAYTSPAVSNVRVTSTPKSHSIGAPG